MRAWRRLRARTGNAGEGTARTLRGSCSTPRTSEPRLVSCLLLVIIRYRSTLYGDMSSYSFSWSFLLQETLKEGSRIYIHVKNKTVHFRDDRFDLAQEEDVMLTMLVVAGGASVCSTGSLRGGGGGRFLPKSRGFMEVKS